MTRRGPWRVVWDEFWASFARGTAPNKRYVGEDQFGNKFYEYERPRRHSNVTRGFDPGPEMIQPSVEWLAWTKNARRFPPSDEEIMLNMQRQQAQLEEGAKTEKMAPKIDSHGIGAADMDKKQQRGFPKYDESEGFEQNPGAKKQGEWEKDGRDDVRK